jgi:hypothetical protein
MEEIRTSRKNMTTNPSRSSGLKWIPVARGGAAGGVGRRMDRAGRRRTKRQGVGRSGEEEESG